MKGFVILSNLNLAWLTNFKCGMSNHQHKIFDLIIVLHIFVRKLKFGIGFVVPKILITYLSHVEVFLYVLRGPRKGPRAVIIFAHVRRVNRTLATQ